VRPTGRQVPLHVPGDQREQPVGDDDRPFRAVFGGPQLGGAVGSALHLTTDEYSAAEEVDVADLQRRRLAEPTQRDEASSRSVAILVTSASR
jgi:hypothetical protein